MTELEKFVAENHNEDWLDDDLELEEAKRWLRAFVKLIYENSKCPWPDCSKHHPSLVSDAFYKAVSDFELNKPE